MPFSRMPPEVVRCRQERSFGDFVEELIEHCMYAEDLDRASWFVYQPRMNGFSNHCLACSQATDEHHYGDDELPVTWASDDHGHAADCSYLVARRRLEPKRGELDADMEPA